jgi:hypothetical protein
MKNWTKAEIKKLKTERLEGQTVGQIGITLNRTAKSIELKCKKLGIPSNYAPPVAVAAETPYKEDRARVSDEVWKERYSTLAKKYEKALKENSVVESLVADIKSQAPLSYSDAPPVVLTDRKGSKSQSAVLLFSDTHVGQIIKPEQTLGFGEYNFNIFLARLKYLEESTISILTKHTTTKIDELVVPMLGDFLHGALNHSAEAAQHVTLFTQYYSAGHAIAQFLRNLSAYVPKLRIQTVVGNHTRWGTQKKMPTENRYSNLDMFLYALVEALTHDVKKIEWNLNMQPFSLFTVQGFTFHASHGDHLRGGDKALGIPNHAFGRQLSTTAQLFAKHEQQAPHYYVTGHLHRGIQLPHALGEIIVNGGFPGLDNYALAENFNPVDAMQRLLFVHPKFGRTAEYPLSLKFAEQHDTPPYTVPAAFPI